MEEIRARLLPQRPRDGVDAGRGDASRCWWSPRCGIVGLASFWVQQRTQADRRAPRARRDAAVDILRYFLTENFLHGHASASCSGMLLAYGINQLLISSYELPRLPALYLPVGALVLWLLGQLAVLGPARRAAARAAGGGHAQRVTRAGATATVIRRMRTLAPCPPSWSSTTTPRSPPRWRCCSRCTTSHTLRA